MREPQLTEQAEADLEEVWEYIARDHPSAADRTIDAILESSRLHAQFPEMGRSREELRSGLRSFVVRPYVVFYRPVADTIEVLRVLHGARDVKSIIDSTE